MRTRPLRLTALILGLAAGCSSTAAGPSGPWQLEAGVRPALFFAEDVPDGVREELRDSFDAAIGAWGNYGPIEYWVVGADPDAAKELAERFSTHRVRRGDLSPDYGDDGGRRGAEFVEWATRAAEIETTGQPFLEAGWNGGMEWGLHLFSSSLPPGWAGLADARPEDDQTVLFHEYFHAIQNAHLDTLDWEERQELMGPVWWVEGSAEFMAQVTTSRLRAAGRLPRDSGPSGRPWRGAWAMEAKLEHGARKLAEHPGLSLGEIGYGPNADIAYDLGAWGVAWLCREAGEEALIQDFYPRLQELGWEGAFEECFGMPPERFYDEFERFLDDPDEARLELLEQYFPGSTDLAATSLPRG